MACLKLDVLDQNYSALRVEYGYKYTPLKIEHSIYRDTSKTGVYAPMNNNPISNVDPNGDNPLLIGAAVGFLSNGIGNLASGQNFFKGWAQASFFGAFGGGVSSVIGGATSGLNGLAKAGIQAGAHGLSGGALSAAQGGNFGSGALSGALSSGIGSGIGASGLNGSAMDWAQWGGGGLGGGLGSVIGGGNFFDGVRQGLITGGLNHAGNHVNNLFSKPNDIIYLLDKQGAMGFGHDAMLIQNFDGTWTYISKSGLNNPDGSAKRVIRQFNSVAEFKANFPRYERMIRFQTSKGQDADALNAALKSVKTPYNFFCNNCGHTVSAGLNAAGLYSGNSIIPRQAGFNIFMHYSKLGRTYKGKTW